MVLGTPTGPIRSIESVTIGTRNHPKVCLAGSMLLCAVTIRVRSRDLSLRSVVSCKLVTSSWLTIFDLPTFVAMRGEVVLLVKSAKGPCAIPRLLEACLT